MEVWASDGTGTTGWNNAVGVSRSNNYTGCEGICGNKNGIFYGGCATCGPGCNCNCVDNKCVEVSRVSSQREGGRYYNQSGISSFPSCSSTMGQCPCSYGGCMDMGATNYDANATCNDGSCQYAPPPPLPQFGCTQVGSLNYDPNADTDDGSCISAVSGCSDPNATNYNPNANVGCSSNFSGYSNFNQQGFGGYEDRIWFN
ncbi:hypothetical protein N8587_01400 [Akkermansiaceae bacterium]|nr:hypothetical protein [Akkermansiaceae bacterium]